MIRIASLILTFIGMAVFAALLLFVFRAPDEFDRSVRDVLIGSVQDRIENTRLMAPDDALAALPEAVRDRIARRLDALRADLESGATEYIVNVLVGACMFDCERNADARDAARAIHQARFAQYEIAMGNLEAFTIIQYRDALFELRRDIRIFAGVNFAAFALAFLLTCIHGRAAKELLTVSLILSATVIAATVWYVFGQDWLMALLFNTYWGWGYAILMTALFVLMLDVALNRARVTRIITDAVAGLFSPAC